MYKVYVGDIGTIIEVDCGETLLLTTNATLEIEKPGGIRVSKPATVFDSTKLRCTMVAGDFDRPGTYLIQPKMTISGWIGRGETVSVQVYSAFDS